LTLAAPSLAYPSWSAGVTTGWRRSEAGKTVRISRRRRRRRSEGTLLGEEDSRE
jgi:hypothetical protein